MNCEKNYSITVASSLPSPNVWWKLNEAGDPRIDSISGLQLNSPNATVIGSAAGKIANGSVHTIIAAPTPAVLTTGLIAGLAYPGTGFDFFGWVKFVALGGQALQVNWLKPTFQGIFQMDWDYVTPEVEIVVIGDGGIFDTLHYPMAAINAGTWYFWRVYYDPSTQKFGVQIGDGATLGPVLESAAIAFSALASTSLALSSAFAVGQTNMYDETGVFWQKLPDAQAALIWNAGAGRTFP